MCITEREKFVVPVRAIGARAILDFPDDVHFSVGVVKYPSSRTLLVRNIGNKEAKFSLSTEKWVWDVNEWNHKEELSLLSQLIQICVHNICVHFVFMNRPFTVSPDNGTLAVNDSIQITVEFQPMTVGDHFRELVLHYDTGELVTFKSMQRYHES